ncbi:MAG: adenylate/guanylate cyclase domain-containing protein [Crocinitomicaceae bacterium]|nr:adenylate/guanylate cyclase domain-containing protein [Crocinitomicaceae bacterium]
MKGLLVISLLFFSFCLQAQRNIDRNVRETPSVEQVDFYIDLAEKEENKETADFYYRRALGIAERIAYDEGREKCYRALHQIHAEDEELLERLKYSIMLTNFLESKGTKDELAEAYLDLGNAYFKERFFEKAIDVYKKGVALKSERNSVSKECLIWQIRAEKDAGNYDDALVSARKAQDSDGLSAKQQIQVFNEKAEIYHAIGAYPEELTSYDELLKIANSSSEKSIIPVTWNNIGYVHKYLGNYPEAKAAFDQVINISSDDKSDLIGKAYFNKGLILQRQQDLDSSLISFQSGQRYHKKANDWELYASSLNMIAMIYYRKDDHFNAQQQVDEALVLSEKHKLAQIKAKAYEIESFIHQDLFEYEAALDSYKKYLSIRDSLATEEGINERSRLFDQYKVEEFEKTLQRIWAGSELEMANLERLEAQREADAQRFLAKEKADELVISQLTNKQLKDKEELDALRIRDQQFRIQNQENELGIAQRDIELKELALVRERLEASKKGREIKLLAQENEIQEQKRLREQEESNNRLRFLSSIIFFILLVLLGILIAYRQLRKRKKRIEEQNIIIAESKKVIEKEKEKSDKLLLNILPGAVAEELKTMGSSKPKSYEEISVGFTDFSGFTMISEKLSAVELVAKLDEIFLEFDKIVENYGLQRIKTIGDAYMFASGLPEYLTDHAERCVNAAIDMRDFISEFNGELSPTDPPWNVRIGVNSGPVVAGVIGIKKFAYDIWGDTVNTAARMESSGEIGKVNISGFTNKCIVGKFDCEYRGKVPAKNKGDIDMYFAERLS